ncbi:MAG: DUF4468 domain-containing protein [Nitrosopumilus sp.]
MFVFIIILFGCAANIKRVESDRSFQKTFEGIGLNKVEIYTKSLQWLAKTYTDAKEVIEFQDKEVGKIIGRGMSTVVFNPTLIAPINVNIQYTLTIDIKDDRFRITFSNFFSHDISGGNIMEDNYLKLKPRLEALSLDLSNYLKTKEEDW